MADWLLLLLRKLAVGFCEPHTRTTRLFCGGRVGEATLNWSGKACFANCFAFFERVSGRAEGREEQLDAIKAAG